MIFLIFSRGFLKLFSKSASRRVMAFSNAFLLPGSVQQMDFCVNGKGSASSFVAPLTQKSICCNMRLSRKALL